MFTLGHGDCSPQCEREEANVAEVSRYSHQQGNRIVPDVVKM